MNISETCQTKSIYTQYISYLKTKLYHRNEKLEKHRIILGHSNGKYEFSNIIMITFEDHTLAHFYRYLTYKHEGDLIAFRFMRNQTKEGRLLVASYAGKIGGTVTNRKNKLNKSFFYNSEWQQKFGDKNGGKRNIRNNFLAKLNEKLLKKTQSYDRELEKLVEKLLQQSIKLLILVCLIKTHVFKEKVI